MSTKVTWCRQYFRSSSAPYVKSSDSSGDVITRHAVRTSAGWTGLAFTSDPGQRFARSLAAGTSSPRNRDDAKTSPYGTRTSPNDIVFSRFDGIVSILQTNINARLSIVDSVVNDPVFFASLCSLIYFWSTSFTRTCLR